MPRPARPFSRFLVLPLGLLLLAGADARSFASDGLEMRAQLGSQQGTVLSSEMPGRILEIPLEDGDRFREGDLLVAFDCSQQRAQLARANAQLRAARNTLEGKQRLAEMNAIGTVELRNSEAEKMKAEADIAYLRVGMQQCRITAPYDGRVVHYAVRPYQSVQAGHELVEIMDDAPLSLEFRVPSPWLSRLEPGHRFAVHIEDVGETYPVRLLRTAVRVDPVSQTVRAVGEIDGHYVELLPGMSGTVQLNPDR